ncbi:MAG: neutral/alkaline non-lysosomal ceramidase N-terminal domain-containing protein [Prolixibacteraceae bacterium]|nr:neutral/alkaline non-lysosomal ceramidase N-terminal domain-containing protein [Prolixibacteraceae bacterium]
MKKFFKIFGIVLLVLLIGVFVWVNSNLKDRNPGYKVDVKIINENASVIKAGFAAIAITPEVHDRWTDKNEDAKYNPKDGDTFTDGNGNGVFDPVWIAGFSNNKPANGIHDDLWARTMVVDDGKTRLAVVAIDAVGFMNDDVIDVRNRIPADAGVTYTMVCSTHTHEGPDLLGLWGETPFKSGINKAYMEYVKNQIVNSVIAAVKNLRPASLAVSEDLTGAIPLVKDTRAPEVFDSGLRIIKAIDKENGATLGSLIAWADHPETLWSKNLLISSDYPHFVREGIEKGVFHGDSLVKPGIGGVAVFVNGALGGLMCTHPSLAVKDPFTGQEYQEPSFAKAEAQGKHLAMLALNAMDQPTEVIDSAGISLVARTLLLPIDNNLFKLATALGVLDRGTTGWMNMRSELSVLKIGPISMVTIPGEAYPELINGGIEAPEGRDFDVEPLEVPAVRDLMPGKYKFVLGLANDEIGYIIPKSQWDVKAPYTYNRKDSPYGEENSLGVETASILHRNIREMLEELNKN